MRNVLRRSKNNPDVDALRPRVNLRRGVSVFMLRNGMTTKRKTTNRKTSSNWVLWVGLSVVLPGLGVVPTVAHSVPNARGQKNSTAGEKLTWKPVDFAIVRYNDDAPASWNMYHGEKKGLILLRLWRRYLFLNVQEQEVYELDPQKVKVLGDNNVEWSASDLPSDPIETSEWKVRDVGPMKRIKFRFGKSGNFLDVQLPLLINGKPMY
jgi:hypothetical protein